MTKQLIANKEKEVKRLTDIETGKLEVDNIKDLEFNSIRLKIAKATLKGIYLGAISEKKDFIKFLKEETCWEEQIEIENKLNQITSEIKQYEDKLKELEC